MLLRYASQFLEKNLESKENFGKSDLVFSSNTDLKCPSALIKRCKRHCAIAYSNVTDKIWAVTDQVF